MATIGKPIPKIMFCQPLAAEMVKCRSELVRRESELMLKIVNICSSGKTAFSDPPGLATARNMLEETRSEIARLDELFNMNSLANADTNET